MTNRPGLPPAKAKGTDRLWKELDEKSKLFIIKFLNPAASLIAYPRVQWAALLKGATELKWPLLQALIKNLPYESYFLKTVYWRIVADRVKERDDLKCQVWSKRGYEVHHVTYD